MSTDDATSGFKLRDPNHEVLNRKAYPADSVIFRKGQQGSDAYVVLRGKVDILGKGPDGKLTVYASMGEGELFGEMALMNNSIRTANAVTKEGCEVLVISQQMIQEKLAKTDPFIQSWIKFLTNRIIGMNVANAPKKVEKSAENESEDA